MRWVLRIFLAVLLLVVIAAGFLIFVIRRSFPEISSQLQLPGLTAPVEVIRDRSGVPHIYAANQNDLFFVQGYVHAQDRFWQMDVWRHTGAGRLAELFGTPLVKTDKVLRTLGWARVVRKELEQLDPVSRAILQSYTQGVNAYLKNHQGSQLSFEYSLLSIQNRNYKPEPWQPMDSLIWGKVMAWDLAGNMDMEIYRALLLSKFSVAQVEELIPPYPADRPFVVPFVGTDGASMNILRTESSRPVMRAGMPALRNSRVERESIGSNNWVIGGRRTATGKPFLCNDPHLGTQMPSIWYEVALHCSPKTEQCPYDVMGFSFAGTPGVIIGHNDRIAWGFTNVGPDVMDLFIEKINPDNPNQYEVNGAWVDMQLVQENIAVAGGSNAPLTVRYTRHGPILSDTFEDLQDFKNKTRVELPDQYAIALRWTALEPTTIFPAFWQANKARNWEEFRTAMSHFDVPSQNAIYADVEGNIGYQMPGRIPIRASGDGKYPVSGWTDEYEWTGYIPFAELPSSYNPDQAYIASANNAVVSAEYPYLIATDWDYGNRAERIVEMIEQRKDPIDTSYLQRMQGDNKNLNAVELVPVLLQLSMNEPKLQQALALLRDWDFQNHMDLAAPALFETFWKHLLAESFHDDLPEDYWPGGGGRWMYVVRRLIPKQDSYWWDNRKTSAKENRDDILRAAFRKAVEELEQAQGSDPKAWRWGKLHTTSFRNGTLGQSGIEVVEKMLNRGPFPTSGGNSIVNATGYNIRRSFEVTDVPSMRMIVDFSDFNKSLVIHTTGQSGHAFHPHYIDQAEPWSRIEYRPMLWTHEAVEKNQEGILRLIP